MALLESGEMYLETILILNEQKNGVHAVDIGEYMGFSKPSVSRALGLLKNGGYITIDEFNHVHLTEAGNEVASRIYERHTKLSAFLIALGVNENTATEDACKIEHDISEESFRAICRYAEAKLGMQN